MFDEAKFVHDVDQEMVKGSFYQRRESFSVLPAVSKDVVDRPLRQKAVCGNNAPFMTKQLRENQLWIDQE